MGIIEISKISVRRGRKMVLSNWSLSVQEGEIVCLVGDNGCGKSTVIESAAGLIPLDTGIVTISDKLVRDFEGRRGRVNFGLCLQDDCIMGDELVGERILDAAGMSFDVESLLAKWDLEHRIHDRVAMLSGGQRRRVALLAGVIPAMISKQPVAVILDEPDSGLDDSSVEKLAKMLRDLAAGGHSVLVSSHDERIIAVADRVVSFPEGEKEQTPEKGNFTAIETSGKRSANIGQRLDSRTLAGLSNNGIAGLLTLGALLALVTPSELEGAMLAGVTLAPALAAGLCGNPMHRLMLENRAFAWWATKSALPPFPYLQLILGTAGLTILASVIAGEIDWQLVAAGSAFGTLTAFIVGMVSHSTLRLSRPNAVMVRLLTPIVILPWALLVETLSA